EIASTRPPADEAIARDLQVINQMISGSRELEIVLHHPSVGPEEKKKLLRTLFEAKVDELTLRLLELLADKRRMDIIPELESEYKAKLNERKNIVNATLISSDPLSEDAVANIKARLVEHLGKRLELEVKVDKSLIGGAVLRLGDQVIDGSLKGKLKRIEKALLAV
ncbi:MAG TPA: ATP synthase F1 subunit delta, partial [Candidatus Obscuribacterales bacterium]